MDANPNDKVSKNYNPLDKEKLYSKKAEDTKEKKEQESASTTDDIEHTKINLHWLFKGLQKQFADFINLRKGADVFGTAKAIRADAEFDGYSAWILILSILIASIGLNLNSTAVVIGAMLISPLMGPLLGIGLGLATIDIETLAKSTKNFILFVVISIVTSTVYFWASPFQEPQSEILGRTSPQLLDVLIAIFGGLAGIIGHSRHGKNNVVPGVAIATALMPPLCTAGFGLANGQYAYFFGAIYLFMLNSAMIIITTLIIIKLLKFPIESWMEKKKRVRATQIIIVISIALILPSCWIFYRLIIEDQMNNNVKKFIEELDFKGSELMKHQLIFEPDSISTLKLFMLGKYIDSTDIKLMKYQMKKNQLSKVQLQIIQNATIRQSTDLSDLENYSVETDAKIEDFYFDTKEQLFNLEKKMEENLAAYTVPASKRDSINSTKLAKDIKLFMPNMVLSVHCGKMYAFDSTASEIHTVILNMNDNYFKNNYSNNINLEGYIKNKLNVDSIQLIIKQ